MLRPRDSSHPPVRNHHLGKTQGVLHYELVRLFVCVLLLKSVIRYHSFVAFGIMQAGPSHEPTMDELQAQVTRLQTELAGYSTMEQHMAAMAQTITDMQAALQAKDAQLGQPDQPDQRGRERESRERHERRRHEREGAVESDWYSSDASTDSESDCSLPEDDWGCLPRTGYSAGSLLGKEIVGRMKKLPPRDRVAKMVAEVPQYVGIPRPEGTRWFAGGPG